MNILKNKFYEHIFEPKIFIGGKWNISIVSKKNGSEKFVLGENKKNNLILNQGLDILAESKYFTAYNGINYNTIPAFLYSTAVLGNGIVEPSVTDTTLTNQLQESTSIKPNSCSTEDDYINGTRTFKKVYDFPSPSSKISVTEIGVNTPFNGKKLFSKFLLGRAVNIETDEFIRLYYDFTVGSSAIINPINVTISSGTVNANGQIKLCGNFNDIFLTMDSNGNPTLGNGDSPRTSLLPYYEKYCSETPTCLTECFGTCFMVDQGSTVPAVNNSLSNEWIGQRLEEINGNISASAYVNGNFYRDITYTFNNDNPNETKNFSGFLFTVTKTNRQNTWDGWFWKFTNDQIKYNSKTLVIVLRQSINRI